MVANAQANGLLQSWLHVPMAVKAAKAAVAGALWHRIQRIWLQQCILAIMPDTNTNASDPHINDFGSASKSLLLKYNQTEAAS